MRYKCKTTGRVSEAIQWTGTTESLEEIRLAFFPNLEENPCGESPESCYLLVRGRRAEVGDWVVKDDEGGVDVCSWEVFCKFAVPCPDKPLTPIDPRELRKLAKGHLNGSSLAESVLAGLLVNAADTIEELQRKS